MTLVPDSWSLKCILFWIFWSSRVFNLIKRTEAKEGDTCTKTFPKKGKAMAQETMFITMKMFMLSMRMMNTADSFLVKKDYVSIQKDVHKQKGLVLCNLHEHELFSLLHSKKETQIWRLGSPRFVLSTLNCVSLQIHQEHTW